MAMNANSIKVLEYLRSIKGANVTSADVAAALGFEKKSSVDGTFTSFQKKGWGVREDAEIQLEDGTHAKVKFLKLTDLGMTVDYNDTDAE